MERQKRNINDTVTTYPAGRCNRAHERRFGAAWRSVQQHPSRRRESHPLEGFHMAQGPLDRLPQPRLDLLQTSDILPLHGPDVHLGTTCHGRAHAGGGGEEIRGGDGRGRGGGIIGGGGGGGEIACEGFHGGFPGEGCKIGARVAVQGVGDGGQGEGGVEGQLGAVEGEDGGAIRGALGG